MEHVESRLQHSIVLWLQDKGVYCHSVPNEGAGRGGAVRTMQLTAMGLRPGVADLVIWWPHGRGVEIGYLEVKTRTGILSERQKAFRRRCQEAGVPYDVVRSLEDVENVLAKHLGQGGGGQ